MQASSPANPVPQDRWVRAFLEHLATDRAASIHTQRNYRQALTDLLRWHLEERKSAPTGQNSTVTSSALSCATLAGNSSAARQFNCDSPRCAPSTASSPSRPGRDLAHPQRRAAEAGKAVAKVPDRSTDGGPAGGPPQAVAGGRGSRGAPRRGGAGLLSGPGGPRNHLFLRPAHQRTVRPAGAGH